MSLSNIMHTCTKEHYRIRNYNAIMYYNKSNIFYNVHISMKNIISHVEVFNVVDVIKKVNIL